MCVKIVCFFGVVNILTWLSPFQDGGKRKKCFITSDMSPATVRRIKQQRLEHKREQSRIWHQTFVSKGVSCFIDVSFFYCMQG